MKTAVVTGVSYGIGESITEALLSEGWKVYGLSRTKPAYDNDLLVWLHCDLSNHEEITKSLIEINEPSIDVFVSNAGVIEVEMATEVSRDSYERTFSVNVLAPMLLVNGLKEKIKKAVIISVSSVSDRFPEADVALYASSKAANTLYFNSLADELNEARIYTLLPDYVDTPMLRGTQGDNKDFDWNSTVKSSDVAELSSNLINGRVNPESGANIIVVSEALKEDLKSPEKLYGYNADTKELSRLN